MGCGIKDSKIDFFTLRHCWATEIKAVNIQVIQQPPLLAYGSCIVTLWTTTYVGGMKEEKLSSYILSCYCTVLLRNREIQFLNFVYLHSLVDIETVDR